MNKMPLMIRWKSPISIYQLRKRIELCKRIVYYKKLSSKLDFLFYKILCPYPDQTRFGIWWYQLSGKIAFFFHRIHCEHCKNIENK